MARTTDTTLRISAKNLASKDIRDVSKDIDNLASSQKQNATAADLAARSLRELRDEQKSLSNVANELKRRGGLIGDLQEQKASLDALRVKIKGTGEELKRLRDVQARGGFGTENIDKQITRVERQMKSLVSQSDRTQRGFNKTAEAAAQVGISLRSAEENLAAINAEAARTDQLMAEATRAVERHAVAQAEAKAALVLQQQVQKEITAEAQRRNQVEAAAAAQRRAEAAQRKAELEDQARIRAELTKRFLAQPAAPQQAPVLGPAGSLDDQAAARAAALRERLVGLLRRQADGGEKLLTVDGRLAAASREVAQALNGEASSLDRTHKLQGIFADTGRKSLSVYQRMRGQILSLVTAYVGLYQAANLVKSAVSVDQERRKIGIQLQTANHGDVQAAASDMKFLRSEADRLGLVFEDVAKNFANYKIAAQAVGASNKTIRKSFSEATQIVTGLGLSGDDAEGVFRAFVQILGKARVQAEELRGQLGDRLPGAVAAFAKANGIALSDLDKHLKTGKGTVQEFLTFLHAYAQQTQGAVQQQSQTLFAQFNRLTNAWRDFLQEFAKTGVSKELLTIVNQLVNKLKGEEGKKFAHTLSDAFVVVGKAILFVIQHFDAFVSALKVYLALQAFKGVANLGISFVQTGVNAVKTTKDVLGFVKTVREARTMTTGLSAGMRALSLLGGPVGVAMGVAAAAIYGIVRAEQQASRAIDDLIDKVRNLHELHGKELDAGIVNMKDQLVDLKKQEAELLDKQRKLMHSGIDGGADNDKLAEWKDKLLGTSNSLWGVNTQLAQVRQNIELVSAAAKNALTRRVREAQQAVDAAKAEQSQQDKFENPNTGPTDAELAKAERLKQARIDMEARAHEALLKMQEDYDNATIDKEVGTQEQIKQNLDATLSAIGNAIQRRKTELENMLNDAKRLKDATAVNDINQAIGILPQLQAEQEARARIKAANDSIALGEKQINELIAQRDAEIEIINTKVNVGLLNEVEGRQAVNDKMLEYKQRIVDAIVALEQQLAALKQSDPDLAKALHVDELIAKLEASKAKAGEVVTTTQMIAKNVGGQLAGGVANFFGDFIKGCTGGIEGVHGIGGAFKYAMNSMREFVADFLVNMGKAIMQAILLKAIMNAINGTSGGYGAVVQGVLAGTGHTGGVVGSRFIGSGNEMRTVSAAVFAGARRFHEGGLPGLRPNEVPTILKKGEEVVTRDDPRNVLNGGNMPMGASPTVDLTIHNSIDSGQVVEAGLASKAGQKAIYNHISANRDQYRQILK